MSLALRKALNQITLPLLYKSGFTGKFPLVVRQRTDFTDCITLQCDRHARGLMILHLKCFDAISSPATSHRRYNESLEVSPLRGATVSLRLYGPINSYWLPYTLGEEVNFAEKMKLWLPAIEKWFTTGQWDQELLPEAFRPPPEKYGILSRLFRRKK